ncbi:hypothetical protein [Campylobacter sp.]|uniref:hypothetical protein n=1 Tax=Campylobacter sp. TaxID=205 RepID=UPI0027BA82A7|nr:hypothetical protein [Campylobacter sp.]
MKNLFLLYACAEKFRAAKIGAINVPLSPEASMAEFHAAKREDAMKFLEFFRKRAERGLEILKFLSARYFGSHKQAAGRRSEILKFTAAERLKSRFKPQKQAAEFLNFAPMPCNWFEILKFTRASAPFADTAQNFISQRGFEILKLICEPLRILRRVLPSTDIAEAGRAARLTSQHTHDAIEKRRAVKINQYLNSAWRRIRLCSAAVRHGYKTARAENFSKFDLTGALLNFISLPPRKFKLALLKFKPMSPRNKSEILNFTPAVRKFKPAPAVRLNFALNSVPHARAAKVENGVKFEGVAKFKRGAR